MFSSRGGVLPSNVYRGFRRRRKDLGYGFETFSSVLSKRMSKTTKKEEEETDEDENEDEDEEEEERKGKERK
ncbi:hypothetical protein M0804_001081 [Polistes exclamans]|nr:hypothetical protein M0804_001081 [Polistes exclamans]